MDASMTTRNFNRSRKYLNKGGVGLFFVNCAWDVAKLFCEPLLCIVSGLGICFSVQRHPEIGDGWLFFGRFYFFGGFLLFLKSYLDDRMRVRLLRDAIDEEKNMDSFE